MKLIRNNYDNIWFTSDFHYNHDRPFIYEKRGFANIREHDEYIRDNFTTLVGKNDIVFHMGDMFFGMESSWMPFYNIMNSVPVYAIMGNHDKPLRNLINKKQYRNSIGDFKEIKIKTDSNMRSITLCHYPMLSWNGSHYESWNLCGHSHGSLPDSLPTNKIGKRLDVGVDVGLLYNKTFMFTYEDVERIMDKKNITEHH